MATTKKAAKQVQVIARYAHKTSGKLNGIVTYAVRSSNGKDIYCTTLIEGKDIYCTTLIEGKASGCGCPAHKPCYHMTQLQAREASRKPVPAKVTESVDEMTMQVATTETVAKPVEEYRMSEGVYAKLAAIAKPVIEEVKVEAPAQVVSGKSNVPALIEHNDYVMNLTAKAEHKRDMLAEIRAIQERAIAQQVANTPDMMKAALTSNRAFSIMR